MILTLQNIGAIMKTEIKEIQLEFKSLDEKGTFIAYGATFGNEDLGGDVVVKGAFAKSLQDTPAEKVYMFYNHDSKEIIGEYTSIKEDEHGLVIEGRLFVDDIKRAQETYFLMKKNLIRKFSIGYQIIKKSFESGKRMLEEIKLIEVSPVTFPMNPEAELLGVKSMNINEYKTIRDFEEGLRDSGFSKKEALEYISGVKELLRDSEEPKEEPKQDVKVEPCSEKEWGELALTLKSNIETLKGTHNE